VAARIEFTSAFFGMNVVSCSLLITEGVSSQPAIDGYFSTSFLKALRKP